MFDSEKKTILDTAGKMVAKGLIEGTAGNISIRLSKAGGKPLIAITPSSLPYDHLIPDDVMIIDFNGNIIEGKHEPSMESPLHAAIYQARPEINAIVHAHPAFCSIAAVTGLDIPPILDEQVMYLGNQIKVSAHAFPGTRELARNVVAALAQNNAVIMANHGALSVGKHLLEALTNCEIMEKAARVFIYSRMVGEVKLIPPGALEKEIGLFRDNQLK